jgi:hypothetical protein
MGKMDCSVADYVEMATTGFIKTVDEYVDSLFIDENVIVHCKDNDMDYKKQEVGELVTFIESRL